MRSSRRSSPDRLAAREDDRALDGVLSSRTFPGQAWAARTVSRQARTQPAAGLGGVAGEEVARERDDVLTAHAQRQAGSG
jgi:hypothetical protein